MEITKGFTKDAHYYALKFASMGISVFPLARGTKLPIEGISWKQTSTTNDRLISKWFQTLYPGCNFGIDCGKSGLAVLDLDVKHGKNGKKELKDLIMLNGKIEPTYTVSTPNKGIHLYYIGKVANSASKVASGIDIRSVGGFVVIPGSIINEGTNYYIEEKEILTFPKLTPWVHTLCTEVRQKDIEAKKELVHFDKPHNIKSAIQDLIACPVAIEGQGGDERTYKTANMVKDRGISENMCLELMAEHYNDRCLPPWDIVRLQTKVNNAYMYGNKRPGTNTAEANFDDLPKSDAPSQTKPVNGEKFSGANPKDGSYIIDENEKHKTSWSDIIIPRHKFAAKIFPKLDHYLFPWLTSQTITMIYGDRGLGKSWFVMSLLDAISKGKDFGPWKFSKSCRTLYFDAEMIGSDVQERLNQLDDKSEPVNPMYVYSNDYALTKGFPRANLYDESWRNGMKDTLINLNIKVWALDNISSVSSQGDENSKDDWNPINQWLLDLRFSGITTLMLHHTNKSGGQRGTGGREDNINNSIELKKPNNYQVTDGARFIPMFKKARIASKDLAMLHGWQFQLKQNGAGTKDNPVAYWECTKANKDLTKNIVKLKGEGETNVSISKILECSSANVSKTVAHAIEEGLLVGTTKKAVLTDEGRAFLFL